MYQTFLLIFALFLLAAAEDKMLRIEVLQGQNAALPCTAPIEKDLKYWACRWYREGPSSSLYGLVSRTPPNGRLRYYVDADTNIRLEVPTLNLVLPQVNCSHAGIYQCYMAAPVGEQNREGRVRLSVTGCIDFGSTPIMDKTPTALKLPNHFELMVAATVVLTVFLVGVSICLWVKNTKKNKAKSVDKLLYPDLAYPSEKPFLTSFMPTHIIKV